MSILNLPPNVMITIFSCLDQRDLINSVRKTCKLWYHLSHERKLWKEIHMEKFENYCFCTGTFNDMLSKVADCVEVLYMDLKQLDKIGILHDSVMCSNLKGLYLYWENTASLKSGRKDYTLHCHDGSQLRIYLPILSSKYAHLKSLHLLSHVVFIKDLISIFVELEEIEIEYCDFTFDNAEAIVESFFDHHKSIKHLSIRFSVFDHKTLSYILSNVPDLKSIDLSNSNFNCDDIDMVDIHQDKLQKLVLTNTRTNDRLLGHLVRDASELHFVSIGDCVDLTNNGLEVLAENCPNVQTLVINEAEYSKCNITDSGLQKVAEHCRNVQVLKMVHCDEIGDLGVEAISVACPNLTILEAARCTAITDASIISIIDNCPLIEKLDLGHCVQVTSTSINKLLKKCRNLRYLNVETCHRLSDINLEQLETNEDTNEANTYVRGVSPDEVKFTLDNENDGTESGMDEPIEHLADAREEHDRIDTEKKECRETSLLEKMVEDKITITAIPDINLPLWHCHIRSLNLGFCSKIDNKCLKQIARYCPDLRSLNVQGCATVTNAGVLAVVQGCLYLRKLNISGGSVFQTSRLTDDCLSHITMHCKHLERLIIVKNHHITTEGIFQIIKCCPKIRELSFASNRSHGIKPENLTQAAGEVRGKTLCIKVLGYNAKITVTTDCENKFDLSLHENDS